MRLELAALREVAPGVLLGHVKSLLKAPAGPLAGERSALFSIVVVRVGADWRIAAFHNTQAT